MGKFIQKNKILILITTVSLLGAVYLGTTYYDFNKSSKGIPDISDKQQESVGEKSDTQESQEDKNEDAQTDSAEDKEISYKITNLNKKDGDIFSIPDEVTFSISPSVDKSKLTLTAADGTVLYSGEGSGEEAKFTVYPAKKVTEGAQGELLIEGYVGSKAVVYQKVKVAF